VRISLALLTCALAATTACQPTLPASEVPPESDAGVLLEPDRNVVLPVAGELVEVTNLPGAEELEVVSPDGAWVGFVSGTTGWASVWAAPMPGPGQSAQPPVQLTNVGIERGARTPGSAPAGFVPVPDTHDGLRWSEPRTLTWTAGGQTYSATVPQ